MSEVVSSLFGMAGSHAQDRGASGSGQASFDQLGTHLSEVTFCVVDLETTGGAETDSITSSAPSRSVVARCRASSRPW